MNKNTITAAAAALAIAALPAASQAYNCAAITGTPTSTSYGSALYSGSYYGQNLANSFSVGLWAKGFTAKYHLYVFSTQYVNLYCPNGSNKLNFSVVQEDAVSGTNATVTVGRADTRAKLLNDGDWHFYCCTFRYDAADPSASFQRLYIDGQLEAEVSGAAILGPAATPDSSRKFTIGGQWEPSSSGGYVNWRAWSGSAADVTVWSRALSAAEVATLATHRAGGFESGLAIYWPLTGTALNDGGNWARGGVSASLASSNAGGVSWQMADDAALPLGNYRCVASPSWVAEHGYAAPPNATFRSWDDPATNIQQAIDAAYKYETVYVMDGTYPVSETIAVTNANTALRSRNCATGLEDRDGTVLDARGLRRALSVGVSGKSNLDIEVSGFTVANGFADSDGGGARLYGKSSNLSNLGKRCRIANCLFTNCVSTTCGGGLYVDGGIVSNCDFRACSAANYGGGLGIANGALSLDYMDAHATLHTAPSIVGSSFEGCTAGLLGGGIGLNNDYHWSSAVIEGCRFLDCTTTNGTSKCRGGHVYGGYGTCLTDCTFGGRAKAQYGAVAALANAIVSNCTFASVSAGDCWGLLHIGGQSTTATRFVGCVVTNCSGTRGFFAEGGSARVLLRNCLVAGNAFPYAFVSHGSTDGVIENCTFASNSNSSGTTAYDLFHGGSSAKAVAVNSIFDSAKAADGNTATFRTVLSNCVVRVRSTPDAEDSGVRVASPQFADAANRDWRLAPTSKCREKGLLLDWMAPGATDLAGAPRLADLYGRAFTADALPDLGCYECQERGILPTMLTVR